MRSYDDPEYSTPEGDDYALPVDQIAPKESAQPGAEPVVRSSPQQQVLSDPITQRQEGKMCNQKEPLRVAIVKDEELSNFERKTVTAARWGIGVAGLSLIVATVAAFFVYQQFSEMNLQNIVLSDTAERARIDANENSKTVAKQLKIAQQQADAAQDQVGAIARQMRVSDQAYVTLGKPDGTVANIIPSPDNVSDSALVVYFHNNGRIPAMFNFGNSGNLIQFVPVDPHVTKNPPPGVSIQMKELDAPNYFRPMERKVSKDGRTSFGAPIATIGGDSTYEGILWEIPQERMTQLKEEDVPFFARGTFQYCDGFGHTVCRDFAIQYVKSVGKFELRGEWACIALEQQILRPEPNYRYLNACEVPENRKELKFTIPGLPKPPN